MSTYTDAKLIVTLNAVKTGKLYSIVPTDGTGDLTVTRATTATRVNSSGLIESVGANIARLDYSNGSCPSILVEPQRTNLALWSDMFANASWTKTRSSIIANTVVSPSGIQDADTYSADGSSGTHQLSQNVALTSGNVYTISFFAKKDTNDFIQILGSSAGFGSNSWANFDISNGVTGSKGTAVTSNILSFGNGWYLCSMTTTATATVTATATATATAKVFAAAVVVAATSASATVEV